MSAVCKEFCHRRIISSSHIVDCSTLWHKIPVAKEGSYMQLGLPALIAALLYVKLEAGCLGSSSMYCMIVETKKPNFLSLSNMKAESSVSICE